VTVNIVEFLKENYNHSDTAQFTLDEFIFDLKEGANQHRPKVEIYMTREEKDFA